MAREVTVGRFSQVGGIPGEVIRDDADNTVCLWDPDTEHAIWLDAHGLDELRELLDRASMPGQDAPPAISETDTVACERCGHKAHPETPLECQWCPEGYCESPPDDERYAELQAENNAAADLDPDWPATYE